MQSFQSVTATIYLFVEAGRNPTTYNGPVMEINIYFIPIIMAPSNTVTDLECVHCVDLYRGKHQRERGNALAILANLCGAAERSMSNHLLLVFSSLGLSLRLISFPLSGKIQHDACPIGRL